MAQRKPLRPERLVLAELRERLETFRGLLPSLTRPAVTRAMAELLALVGDIQDTRAQMDPIKDPGPPFDPTEPDTAGRVVALALLAQARIPLARIARSYGSGVYAIYYTGASSIYAPASRTETPVYVGKADPKRPDARTSREQGPQLFGRLADHRRMIKQVGEYAIAHQLNDPLRLEDFECRRLVCATNVQLVAERHLIGTFRPIWNSEVKIAYGISKHGDDADTRQNGRSPWDVLHPGRPWAMRSNTEQFPMSVILEKVAAHFTATPPYRNVSDVMREILQAFSQNAPMVSEEQAEADDELEAAEEALITPPENE